MAAVKQEACLAAHPPLLGYALGFSSLYSGIYLITSQSVGSLLPSFNKNHECKFHTSIPMPREALPRPLAGHSHRTLTGCGLQALWWREDGAGDALGTLSSAGKRHCAEHRPLTPRTASASCSPELETEFWEHGVGARKQWPWDLAARVHILDGGHVTPLATAVAPSWLNAQVVKIFWGAGSLAKMTLVKLLGTKQALEKWRCGIWKRQRARVGWQSLSGVTEISHVLRMRPLFLKHPQGLVSSWN